MPPSRPGSGQWGKQEPGKGQGVRGTGPNVCSRVTAFGSVRCWLSGRYRHRGCVVDGSNNKLVFDHAPPT